MFDVIIVGAGIAGLYCAHRLSATGKSVQILERNGRSGGSILTERRDGFLLEMGPNTIQRSTPELERLIDELNLAPVVVEAAPAAERRYVVRDGKPVPVPSSPKSMLTTELLSWEARLGILAEPFRKRGRLDGDESVASFVRRRLGQEFLDYTIDPFVSGVYAGDPDRLSIRHAFPKVYRLEEESGSLIRGSVRAMRRRAALPKPRWKMFNFESGLAGLVDAIADELGRSLRLNNSVSSVQPSGEGWQVTADGVSYDARSVILAVPLYSLARIDSPIVPHLPAVEGVVYPPLAVVHSAYEAASIAHPLDGFGMLVPSRESGIEILGSLFTSSLFPTRAPDGHALLTTFFGGRRRPDIVDLDDAEILHRVHRDLVRLLGVAAPPVFTNVHRWTRAIPQYEVGYGAVKDQIAAAERVFPGLHFAGNYVGGVSVTDTIRSAEDAAARVLDALNASASGST